MFRKFDINTDISSKSQLKSSQYRAYRQSLSSTTLTPAEVDEILPPKGTITLLKSNGRVNLYAQDGTVKFFTAFDSALIPTLRILHKCTCPIPYTKHVDPGMMKSVRVDKGAIKFILSGANIMIPGLLSPGASLPPDLPNGAFVGVYAEGKAHACAIGKLLFSSEEMRVVGKGVGIEVVHCLGDDLYMVE